MPTDILRYIAGDAVLWLKDDDGNVTHFIGVDGVKRPVCDWAVEQLAEANSLSSAQVNTAIKTSPPLVPALAAYDIGRYAPIANDVIDLLNFSQASGSWTFSAGTGVSTALNATYAKEFTNCVRIACPATSGVNGQARSTVIGNTVDLTDYSYIEVTLFSEEYIYDSPTGGNIYLFTNYSADYYWVSIAQIKPGWNIIRLPKSAFATGGSPNWNAITQIRFQCSSSTLGTRTLHYAAVKAVKADQRRAVISLGFDDGLLDHHIAGVLAAERGIRMTFFCMPVAVGDTGWMTHDQIDELKAMGHEIALHGPTSQSNWPTELASVGETVFRERRLADREFAIEHGWDYEISSYPQGLYDPLITDPNTGTIHNALRDAGIKYCRGTNNYLNNGGYHCMYSSTYPKSGMYIGGGLSLNSDNNLAALEALVDAAIAAGGWINIYGHALQATAADTITWAESDYIDLLDYLVAKRDAGLVDLRPFGQVARDLDARGFITSGDED